MDGAVPGESGGAAGPSAPGVVTLDSSGRFERLDAFGSDVVLDRRLHRYAQSLIHSGRSSAAFLWIAEDGRWARVELLVPPVRANRHPTATVTVTDVEPPHGMTVRELDVLTLLAGGLSNAAAARYLGTSPRTVGKQVESVLDKLGQPNRGAAAAFAVDAGLLRLPIPGGCPELSALAVGALHALDSGTAPLPRFARTPPDRTRNYAPRPLRIGLMAPLLGRTAADGEQLRDGAALAVAEINARGGVSGHPLEIETFPLDNQDEHSVEEAFGRAGAHDLAALVGGYLLTDERRSYELAADYGVPYLNVCTSDLQASWVADEPGRFRNVFQAGPRRSNYLRGFLRFAAQAEASGTWHPRRHRIGVVETTMPDTEILSPQGADLLAAAGWEVAFSIPTGPPYRDWPAIMERVRREDPDVVLLAHHPAVEAARFQREFARDPIPAVVYHVYSPSVPEFLARAGAAAEGAVWATVTGRYGDALGTDFARRYAAMHGKPPGLGLAGAAYDQVNTLARAFPPAPTDVAGTLRNLRTGIHRGVNGAYFLGAPGQTNAAFPDESPDPSLAQAQLVVQVHDGAHRVIGPAPYAEAAFRPPPWMPPPRSPHHL